VFVYVTGSSLFFISVVELRQNQYGLIFSERRTARWQPRPPRSISHPGADGGSRAAGDNSVHAAHDDSGRLDSAGPCRGDEGRTQVFNRRALVRPFSRFSLTQVVVVPIVLQRICGFNRRGRILYKTVAASDGRKRA
jgi:hypothetical protein